MNELLLKDFIIPLVLLIVGSSFTGAVAVGWWGVQRIVKGQDDMLEALKEIRDEISTVKQRTTQLETRESMRDEIQKERHRDNTKKFDEVKINTDNIWKELRDIREGAS